MTSQKQPKNRARRGKNLSRVRSFFKANPAHSFRAAVIAERVGIRVETVATLLKRNRDVLGIVQFDDLRWGAPGSLPSKDGKRSGYPFAQMSPQQLREVTSRGGFNASKSRFAIASQGA